MLPGGVFKQMVSCGKPNCRCARGELHGPYFYHFFKVGGRMQKKYVKPSDLDRVRAECEARRQHQRETRAFRQEWRALQGTVREIERNEPAS